jgi:hypothetical protein
MKIMDSIFNKYAVPTSIIVLFIGIGVFKYIRGMDFGTICLILTK